MASTVIFPDLELWLTGWLRARIPGAFISNRFPDPGSDITRYVIVRDDSGPDAMATAQRSVGITVLAESDTASSELARTVAALLRTSPAVEAGNPVASVDAIRGPYRIITNTSRSEYYLTADLVIVGEPFEP